MEMKKTFNIHSLCRICLDNLSSDNVYDLFLVPGLAKKLIFCTSLTVEPQDGFPKNLCKVCYSRLNELHDFQKQCIDSVQKFQELVRKTFVDTEASVSEHFKEFNIFDDEQGEEVRPAVSAADDDELVSFDPLLNSKCELIENEDDVFKMLANVNKAAEEVVQLDGIDIKPDNNKFFSSSSSSSDFSGDDNDDDFTLDTKADENVSDSEDDRPLSLRFRNKKPEPEPKSKPKRKRIPAAERHLHRIIDCHICHKKFKKVECYQKHMTYHNDKLPHQCTVESCLKGFTTANGLRFHIEHCHAETVELHKCPEEGCGRSFGRTRLLNLHLNKAHKIVKDVNEPKCYPCTDCEKVFRCPMALRRHMYKHDGKELPFPCNICGKRFVVNAALKDHLMRHAGIKNYVCPYCGVGKTTRQELNTHITTHTQERKFQCHLCPHASHNRQNLRIHVKIVHDKIKDYACQHCGKTFGKSNACKMHEMTHTGEKRCECKVCGKKFIHSKGLIKHLKIHENRIIRPIEVHRQRQLEIDQPQPPLPALPIPTSNSKESHQIAAKEILKAVAESTATIPKNPRSVKRVEMSELAGTAVNPIPQVAVSSWSPAINLMMKEAHPYVCADCGQGFNGQGNLKRHHRIVHEGVKDFACRFCERRFAKAETLKHHEMTHTGEKPHECNQCGKRFIQYIALKRHMKVHVQKPTEIQESAVQQQEKHHEMTHTEEKPHECNQCGKRFSQHVALKRHMKVHDRKPTEIPAAVYAAAEELAVQQQEENAAKCKAEAERAIVAAAAKEQLEEMQKQELAMQKIQEEVKENARLGNFSHIIHGQIGK